MLSTRRIALAAMAGVALAFSSVGAIAQDWKAKYPALVFGKIPDENATGTVDRYTPFVEFLSKKLGVPVTIRVSNDYAALIEAQRAGLAHIGMYGPASFARALKTGVKVTAFAIETNLDGTKGYHSVLWVKKDSPYQKIEDLKGKNLCLVDPNSTSGNNVPRYAMNKMGIDPENYFSKVVYAGSHDNAVLAVQQGTCEAAFNWWNDEQESMLMRMAAKGAVKAEDFRMIFKSDQIVNSPMAYLDDMPADLKKSIADAALNWAKEDPEGFKKAFAGKVGPYVAVDNTAYQPVIELITFVDTLRKK